jgi:hypothetical protein
MADVLVATSIAPINIENQRKAIDTWIKAGLDVISFNCIEEYEAVKILWSILGIAAMTYAV